MFMVVSWARAIMSISKKAWTFPARPYYYILFFLKINRKPNKSKTEGRKGHTGPLGQPRGEELPCRFLSHPVTLSLGQPQGEELPCRFLSCPMTLSGTGRIPAAPNSNPLQYFMDKISWTEEPGGLQSKGVQRVRYNWATEHTHIINYSHHVTILYIGSQNLFIL